MSNAEIIKKIEQSYRGKDFQMVERLEAYSQFPNESEFKNYLRILIVMIERSEAGESAVSLLWKKIFQEHIGRNDTNPAFYGRKIFDALKELAIFPYRNLATSIGRLIATIIYDTQHQNTRHITEVTSREQLLSINEFFVSEHIRTHNLDNDLLTISYNCIARIEPETFRIFLSEKACRQVKYSIMNGQFDNYLSYFIRPYYTCMSSYASIEARYHVPEPFYQQFFHSYEEFMEMLGLPEIGRPTLQSEVWSFMVMFKQNSDRNIPFVDIGPLNLTKKFHHNVRERNY